MTIDLRLLPLAAACWLGCAMGLHVGTGWGLLVVTGVATITTLLRPTTALVCGAILLGSVIAALRVAAADPSSVADLVRNSGVLHVTAVINTAPQQLEQRGFGGLTTEPVWQAQVTLIAVGDERSTLHVSLPATMRWKWSDPVPEVGATVRGDAVLHPDEPARRSTYVLAMRSEFDVVAETTRGSRLTTNIRNSLAAAVRADASDARAGATLLPGLVLGDTRAQSREAVDDLRTSGLSHLTAVSGANVAIVLGAVLWLLQRTRLRREYRYGVLMTVLVLFVAVVQPQPSVMRAAVMGAIAVYALATGAAKQSASALWLSVVLLLLIDPFMAWQFGFGLSVAATAGLIVLQPVMAEHLPRHRVISALLVTIAAQIATLPLLLLMGQPPTWLSIPANLLAEPLVAPATISGFVATAIASLALLGIPVLTPLLQGAAFVVALPGVLLGDVIVWIARTGTNSVLSVSPFATFRSSMIFGVVVIALWRLRRHRRVAVALLCSYLVLSMCSPRVLHRWPPDDWWYAICDVGQGDASVLRVGAADAIVVDAGPDARAMRRCIRALGVRRVPLLVLTHFHADHVEGVSGLLAQASVQRVIATPLHDPLIEYQRTAQLLSVPIDDIRRGDHIIVGDVELEALWPDPNALSGDPNNSSVVLLARTPHGTLLLTGDAGPDAQSHLAPPPVDILKVPHHGSRYQLPEFLAAAQPRLSVISVGAGNDYGHPASDTVAALRSEGSRVLRTDRVGSVAVVGTGPTMAFVAERS